MLRESLVNGTCRFKRLLPAEMEALRSTVNEQQEKGENPYGKRKRRNDAGKSRKRQKIAESTMRHSTSPPSDHQIHEASPTVQSDSDGEDTGSEDTGHEHGARQACETIGKRAVNTANPVRRNMTSTNPTLGRTQQYQGGASHLHATARPAQWSFDRDDDSEGGEEELDNDDVIALLNGCTKSLGGDYE